MSRKKVAQAAYFESVEEMGGRETERWGGWFKKLLFLKKIIIKQLRKEPEESSRFIVVDKRESSKGKGSQ